MRKTRLAINTQPLNINNEIRIEDGDFEYLIKVMRKKIGDEIYVFNGNDGEFIAKISAIEKRHLIILITKQISTQEPESPIILAFAPVKNIRIDFVATKATEMGVGKFLPIITNHSVVDKINEERFKANIKEACEQCERNTIPQLLPIKKLSKLLQEEGVFDSKSENKSSDKEKILILCDESKQGSKASIILPKIFANKKSQQEIIVLIGPEGGFSKEEFTLMHQIKNLHSISLGKRILRSDTAIISALALVQEFLE